MASTVRKILRTWFGRGQYPTAEQFSDLFDSFFHRTEDRIPLSTVEGLADELNGKYSAAEGHELAQRTTTVAEELRTHEAAAEQEFDNIQNDIEGLRQALTAETTRATTKEQQLDKALQDETDRATAEEQAIRQALTTETTRATTKEQQLDKALQDEANRATAEEQAIRQALAAGDAATLQSANSHTDSKVATEQSSRESGDRNTLASAKEYADSAVAGLVNGSPAALDTLRELADALGGDPNFATTVAGQIGSKVDKVTGKGLSTEDYTPAEKSKLAGIAAGANNYTHPAAHPASIVTQDSTHRFVTDTEKTAWNAKAEKTTATTGAAGLMAAADKQKLDGIAAGANNYTHPAAHPASIVTQDSTHRFVTDTEKTAWNGLLNGPQFVVTGDEAYALAQRDGKIYIVIEAE